MRRLTARSEDWPLRSVFRIARGEKHFAHVVMATLSDGHVVGRGEGAPLARYAQTQVTALQEIDAIRDAVEGGLSRVALINAMRAGAARNALDGALWDLEAKLSGEPVWRLAGLTAPQPVQSAVTISLDTPEAMAHAAVELGDFPLLKVKLGGPDDQACMRAVRDAAPRATLIVDANEAWTMAKLEHLAPVLAGMGVTLIEQPLPSGQDEGLERYSSPVPLCADESFSGDASLDMLKRRYALINLKLDKVGGLTAAIGIAQAAAEHGLGLMLGCMASTSLAIAPAMMLGAMAHIIDLDGPLLLAQDRAQGLRYDGARVFPPDRAFWG